MRPETMRRSPWKRIPPDAWTHENSENVLYEITGKFTEFIV